MNAAILLPLVIATLFGTQACYWLARWAAERRRDRMLARLRWSASEAEAGRGAVMRHGRLAESDRIDRLLRRVPALLSAQALLAQTELDWTVGTLAGATALGIVLGCAAGLLARSVLLTLIGAGLGALLPTAVALRSRALRIAAISRQLPEALDLICRSLRAGHALPGAIKVASDELPQPIATEFLRCHEAQALGASLEEAALAMGDRVPGNLDLRIFVVSLLIQRQVGGNLAEILERIAATIRERYKFFGQVRALTAEGRMSGVILGAMPWLVLLVLWTVRRRYLQDFWADSMGRTIALGALALWIAGVLWMRRVVRVEV